MVFGAVVSGRGAPLPGIEAMLGLFINTVPVRVRVDPRQPLVPWLKMIPVRRSSTPVARHPALQRSAAVDAAVREQHHVHELPLDASLTHGAHGLAVDEVQLYNRADIPLEFVVTARDDWKMELSFDPRRFDEDTMQRMLGHVAARRSTRSPPSRSRILPEAERRQLLETFNDTVVRRRAHRGASPSRPPRTTPSGRRWYRDSVLSAGELNARANRIAHRLLAAAELGPDTLVAICITGRRA